MLKQLLDTPEQEDEPWDALLFVTGHINYGGRVTDDNDRQYLLSLLDKHCHKNCLEDDYRFSPSGLYYAPEDGDIDEYRDYIHSLPMNDDPEIFGLHDNANIVRWEQDSNSVIEAILSIQPRLAAAGGPTPDEIVLEKSKDILEQLPETLDKKVGLRKLFKPNPEGAIPSLGTVLL